MTIKTRFAPSPTGMLHIGNARTALINFLYTKKFGGEFILRIDDTDLERSSKKYEQAIIEDLHWLGLDWDSSFRQSEKLNRYQKVKEQLIASGRLYPCFETAEELDIKRKLQLAAGKPPIYDRAALQLSAEQIAQREAQNRMPHYRFLVNHEDITWQDLVKGNIHYHGANLSDPIVIREDGSLTYMICSTVDDIDSAITHVIRGEDHVTNTAIQVQMFAALNATPPAFGHLSLVKSQDNKISKRTGGYDIASFRDEIGYEAMTINSFLATIGTSQPVAAFPSLKNLIEDFSLSHFSLSPTTYLPEELSRLNHKIVINLSYLDASEHLKKLGADYITEEFWQAVRPNLITVKEVISWWDICHNLKVIAKVADAELLQAASKLLPTSLNKDTWQVWTKNISDATGRKGKELFMPLRLALTGRDNGPDLKDLLPLIGRQEIIRRLESAG